MTLDNISLLKERVNLRTVLVSIIVAILGILMLFISARKEWWVSHESWQIVVQNIGSLLFVTVAIALIWELWGKRAFSDEILAKVRISKDITSAGIINVTNSFLDGINWRNYFRTVKELDIFFAYGRTWRNTYVKELRDVAARKDTEIRVLLPDPEDEQTVSELARRFNYSDEEVKSLIRDAEEYFEKLRSFKGNGGAKIELWFLPAVPVFSFYRFDTTVILALLSHRRDLVDVPVFVCEKGGTLFDYIQHEFDFMISHARPAREGGVTQ